MTGLNRNPVIFLYYVNMLLEEKQSTKDTLLVLSCTDKRIVRRGRNGTAKAVLLQTRLMRTTKQKVPQRNSRLTFRSLINCNAQPKTTELAKFLSLRT